MPTDKHTAQETLRAKAFYCGDEVPTKKRPTRMAAGTGAAPGQAPPDLPSLLLDGRICYIGMPVSRLLGSMSVVHPSTCLRVSANRTQDCAGYSCLLQTVQLTPCQLLLDSPNIC